MFGNQELHQELKETAISAAKRIMGATIKEDDENESQNNKVEEKSEN